METTRHFTASIYIVHAGQTALHHHDRLDMWLPPGGHLRRDELPHEAAIREAHEETGLTVALHQSASGARSGTARPIPAPETILLEDINVYGDAVGHQHIDLIYFGRAEEPTIAPIRPDEAGADRWEWFDPAALTADERIDPDVSELGAAAIAAVAEDSPATGTD